MAHRTLLKAITVCALGLLAARGQPPINACLNTVAGGGAAIASAFSAPSYIALDSTGTLVFSAGNSVYRAADDGMSVTVLAGSAAALWSGDGGPAADAMLGGDPNVISGGNAVLGGAGGVVLRPSDNALLVADNGDSCIRAIWTNGTISTIAGTFGMAGYSGDGGAATAAQLSLSTGNAGAAPGTSGIGVDAAGTIFVADTQNSVIRAISSTGLVSTAAGTGIAGWSGDGGAAVAAMLALPTALALDGAAGVVFSDSANVRLRRINRVTGVITHVAGTGSTGPVGFGTFAADGALAATGGISTAVRGVAVRPADRAVVFSDTYNYRLRVISSATGALATLAGTGSRGGGGNGGPATAAQVDSPAGLLFAASGDLYFAELGLSVLRVIRAATGIVSLVLAASPPAPSTLFAAGLLAVAVQLQGPRGLATAANGDIYISDATAEAVRVLRANGTIGLVAGSGVACAAPTAGCGDGGAATAATLNFPYGLAVRSNGDLVIGDSSNHRVRIVSNATGAISTLAGTGVAGRGAEGSAANASALSSPFAVAVHPATDDVYVADTGNFRIRRVFATGAHAGAIVTVAGNGSSGANLRPAPALGAVLGGLVYTLAFGPDGSLFVPDFQYNVVYVLSADGATLSLFAGQPWRQDLNQPRPASPNATVAAAFAAAFPALGDGGAATSASLLNPIGVAADPLGNVYIATAYDYLVRMVDAGGTIWTAAGNGTTSTGGDGGLALSGALDLPRGLALDPYGNLYIAESGAARVREVELGYTPNCPAGYYCACGLRPTPCSDPAVICPPGTTSPSFLASPGFAAAGVPSALSSTGVVYTTQAPCPAGSYCAGGVATPCPAGSFGRVPQQATGASCHACANGTYLTQPGVAASSASASPCAACPVFSYSAAGAPFCPWLRTTACAEGGAASPVDPLLFTFPGPWPCAALPDGAATSVVGGGTAADVQLPPVQFLLPSTDQQQRLELSAAVPIAGVLALPVLLVLVTLLLRRSCCPGPLRRCAHVFDHRVLYPTLRAADQIGDWKIGVVGMSRPVHWEGTTFGGSCSLLAMGVTFAFMAVIVVDFLGAANAIVSKFVLPARASSVDEVASYAFTALSSGGPAWMPALSSGLLVQVALAGPDCGSLIDTAAAAGAAGSVTYAGSGGGGSVGADLQDDAAFEWSVAASGPASSPLFVHSFACPACAFKPLSSLALTFNGTCHSAAILVGGVGAQGAVSLSARLAEPDPGAYLAGAYVAVAPAIEVLENKITGVTRRGLLLSVSDITTYSQAAEAPVLAIAIALPAPDTYSGISVEAKFLAIDLVYQLLATLAFGAFFTFAFLGIAERRKRFELREKLAKKAEAHAHGAHWDEEHEHAHRERGCARTCGDGEGEDGGGCCGLLRHPTALKPVVPGHRIKHIRADVMGLQQPQPQQHGGGGSGKGGEIEHRAAHGHFEYAHPPQSRTPAVTGRGGVQAARSRRAVVMRLGSRPAHGSREEAGGATSNLISGLAPSSRARGITTAVPGRYRSPARAVYSEEPEY